MKTYLPYFYKKAGVIIVIVAIAVSFIAGINKYEKAYIKGYNYGYSNSGVYIDSESTPLTYKEIISPELSNTLNWLGSILAFGGFLLYIFSKEKIDDEFLQKLRAMSLEKSLIFTWLVAFVFLIIKRNIDFEAFYILQIQLLSYVLIYHFYKRKFLAN